MSARVLVIDDDERLRRTLASSLTRAGFDVMTAEDGDPALALSTLHEFDAVVVDFHMKTMNGDQVVRHFKALFGSRVYCAVLSGEDDDETRDACRAAGADDIFLKPASPKALRERLSEVTAGLRGAA